MKLYKIVLKGLHYCGCGAALGTSYVVAEDPTTAYKKLRAYLDENDVGFQRDRELDRIELIADGEMFGGCGTRVFL